MGLENTRLLIVVESTDYRAALSTPFRSDRVDEQRLSGLLSAADIHILKAAIRWSSQVQEVALFSCYSAERYSDRTSLNIRIMGSGISTPVSKTIPKNATEPHSSAADSRRQLVNLLALIADFCPSRLVLCTPLPAVLRWATRHRISTLALFSDWREPQGGWRWWQRRLLVSTLNHRSVEWVGAQGLQASQVLASSGINATKLIPWEWSPPQPLNQPLKQYAPKQMRDHNYAIELVYVGALAANAGIEDVLKAAIRLRRNGYQLSLQLISSFVDDRFSVAINETTWLKKQIQDLGLVDSVSVWTGLALAQMLVRVRSADLMIIPRPPHQPISPPAIAPSIAVSLAQAAYTPIVVCDHAYWNKHLLHGVNAVSFPLGNAKAMAHRIERLMGQASLYAQLSAASSQALDQIKVPACWATLVEKWMCDTAYDRQWLSNFVISSGRYQPVSVQSSSLRSVTSSAIEAVPSAVTAHLDLMEAKKKA